MRENNSQMKRVMIQAISVYTMIAIKAGNSTWTPPKVGVYKSPWNGHRKATYNDERRLVLPVSQDAAAVSRPSASPSKSEQPWTNRLAP